MTKRTLCGAILSTAMITVTGVALAAGPRPSTDSDNSGSGNGEMMKRMSPAMPHAEPGAAMPNSSNAPRAMQPGMQPGIMSREADSLPALPPESVVGKTVNNADGDKIGEVSKIVGDRVVISVGGFLGIGSHDVALNWKQLKTTGSGDDIKLETALTKDELKNLPEYKE